MGLIRWRFKYPDLERPFTVSFLSLIGPVQFNCLLGPPGNSYLLCHPVSWLVTVLICPGAKRVRHWLSHLRLWRASLLHVNQESGESSTVAQRHHA